MEKTSSFLENSSFSLIQFGFMGSSSTPKASKDSSMILETNFLEFAYSISLITSFQLMLYSRFHLHLTTYLCYNYLQLIWGQNFILNSLFKMMECFLKFKKYFDSFQHFIKFNSHNYFIVLFYSLLRAFSFLFLFFIIYFFLVQGQFYLFHYL